jgi:hypothetical protein
VLSASEVSTIYNSGSPKDESRHSGIVAYYTMESYEDGDEELVSDLDTAFTLTINNNDDIDSSDTP